MPPSVPPRRCSDRWLNRVRRSERGNGLIVGAASRPLLIGSAALAVDTIQLSLWKRQLQRAADSGAIAGAYAVGQGVDDLDAHRSEEHTSELQSLMRTSYAVFCLKK